MFPVVVSPPSMMKALRRCLSRHRKWTPQKSGGSQAARYQTGSADEKKTLVMSRSDSSGRKLERVWAYANVNLCVQGPVGISVQTGCRHSCILGDGGRLHIIVFHERESESESEGLEDRICLAASDYSEHYRKIEIPTFSHGAVSATQPPFFICEQSVLFRSKTYMSRSVRRDNGVK